MHDTDQTQARLIADQVAEAAITRFEQSHPRPATVGDMPAPLKWAAGIVSAVMAACTVGMALWVVSTLSDLQQTVTRIDERQSVRGDVTDERFGALDRRVTKLENARRR